MKNSSKPAMPCGENKAAKHYGPTTQTNPLADRFHRNTKGRYKYEPILKR